MNLAGWVEKWGRAAGERTAIAFGAAPYVSYRQWAARSRVLAGNLRALCGPDDRVAVAMSNRPEFLEALFAIWHAGLVAVPMNAKLHADELGYIVGHSQASLILASPDLADDVAPHGRTVVTGSAEWRRLGQGDGIDVVERRPDDLAWLFYTSGTTGRPKGAMLTHRNLMAMTLAYLSDIEPVGAGDAKIHPAPLSHGSGLYALPFVAMGAKNVVPESGGFDPDEIAALLAAHGNVSFFAAPTMVSRLSTIRALPAPIIAACAPSSMAAARCMWRICCKRMELLRTEIRADLRPGRSADDHHQPVEGAACRPARSALARGHGLGRAAAR